MSPDDTAIFQLDALDLFGAEDLLSVGLGDDVNAAFGERLFQEIGGSRIELALHDRRHQVDDGDIHTLPLKAIGRLKAEQAGADDDGPPLPSAIFSMASTSSRSR